jgi:predicted nucleic acid-binding protein
MVFVDTSGFYAFLDQTDAHHADAERVFRRAFDEGWELVTTNYVVQECWSLLQSRVGWDAVEGWCTRMLPRCRIAWIDASLHELGAARCRQARERGFSLTDAVTLAYMHENGIRHAIAFDRHFEREGVGLP